MTRVSAPVNSKWQVSCVTRVLQVICKPFNTFDYRLYNMLPRYEPVVYRSVIIALLRFLHNRGNIATEGSPKSRLCRTIIEWQGLFVVHSTINSTLQAFAQFRALYMSSLDDKHSNAVPLSFGSQSDQMRHQGRPSNTGTSDTNNM